MKLGKALFVTLVLVAGLLAGCSSIEDETHETESAVEEIFKAKSEAPNSENGEVSYFLPSDMKIENKDANNVILNKGDQTFILFVNPNETQNSEVLYEEIQAKKFEVNKSFKDKERFGFVKVYEIEEEVYIVSVGIGGVKMTTEAKVNEISESASEMMKVVSSVKY